MFKISKQVVNFITKSLENGSVELSAKKQIVAEVEIQRGTVWVDSLCPPPHLFLLAMMALSHILRKYKGGNIFT